MKFPTPEDIRPGEELINPTSAIAEFGRDWFEAYYQAVLFNYLQGVNDTVPNGDSSWLDFLRSLGVWLAQAQDYVPEDLREPLPPVPTRKGVFDINATGLVIKADNPTFEEWQSFGKQLVAMKSAVSWAIGDWLLYGEAREAVWGEKYAQALDEFDYEYGTLRNYAYIARRFTQEKRIPELTQGHHAAVAALDPIQQDNLLTLAKNRQLSREALRVEVRKLKAVNEGTGSTGTDPVVNAVLLDVPLTDIKSDGLGGLRAYTDENDTLHAFWEYRRAYPKAKLRMTITEDV